MTTKTSSVPESHRDLLEAPVAILSTIDPEGRPQQTAVWFVHDGGDVKISLNTDRKKTQNLRANPAVGFFVLDPENAHRYLEVRGDAEIEPDPDYAFAGGPVRQKYGADVRNFDAPGSERVVVTIRPTRVNAVTM